MARRQPGRGARSEAVFDVRSGACTGPVMVVPVPGGSVRLFRYAPGVGGGVGAMCAEHVDERDDPGHVEHGGARVPRGGDR